MFLNFCGNPEYLYFCSFYSSSTAFDELHDCVGKILDQFSHDCYDRDHILRNGIMQIAQKSFVAVPVQECFCEYTTCIIFSSEGFVYLSTNPSQHELKIYYQHRLNDQ